MSNQIIEPVEVAMQRFKSQSVLFASRPSRVNLLGLELPSKALAESTVVNVWRNHAFEPILPIISNYAAFRSWPLTFRLGSYDDSFSFSGFEDASLELLWIDSSRFMKRITFFDWLEWLQDRLRALRQLSSAPIVLATWLTNRNHRDALSDSLQKYNAVYYADLKT